MKNKKLMRSPRSRDNIIADVPAVASRNAEKTCQSNFRSVAGRLPAVKCEYGAEILLLPDVKAMSHAIEVHVAEHMRSVRSLRKINRSTPSVSFAGEAERVRAALVAQVLSEAGKSENGESRGGVESKLKCNAGSVERFMKALEINGVCGDDDGGEFRRDEDECLGAKVEKLKRCMWYVA